VFATTASLKKKPVLGVVKLVVELPATAGLAMGLHDVELEHWNTVGVAPLDSINVMDEILVALPGFSITRYIEAFPWESLLVAVPACRVTDTSDMDPGAVPVPVCDEVVVPVPAADVCVYLEVVTSTLADDAVPAWLAAR